MEIAGIAVDAFAVLELAERLVNAGHGHAAALLLSAQASGDERVWLSIGDRDAVLAVLHEPPDELRELRGALVVDRLDEAIDGVV